MLAIASCALAQASRPHLRERAIDWSADLDFLAKELPARHKNAFHALPEPEWRARVTTLRERIATRDDDSMIVELARLVASLQDSHTMVGLQRLAESTLPLRLVWWPDGLRVFAARKEDAAAVGMRVTAIAGVPIAKVADTLADLQHADNEGSRQSTLASWVTLPRLLAAVGVAKTADEITFACESDPGEARTLALAPGKLGADAVYPSRKKSCVTDQRGRDWHHFEWLAEERIAYVQFNQCATSKEHDLTAFTDRVAHALESAEPRALVFDLQYNGGGNSALGDQLFARLATGRKNVFCVIGPQTFSSALLNAQALKDRYGATLVGRPTGGKPTHFGEVRSFVLPSSQLTVQYSTKLFRHGDEHADAMAPDHLVARTYAQWLAGEDPVLDKIRSLIR